MQMNEPQQFDPEDCERSWEKLEPLLATLAKPGIRLRRTNVETGTKFGGQPRVESSAFEWPRVNGKPMSFLAQLNLSELSAAHNFSWLPLKGSLLFFFDKENAPSDTVDGGYEKDWKILYVEDPKVFAEFPEDLGEQDRLEENFLLGAEEHILPGFERPCVLALELGDMESDELESQRDPEGLKAHQIGGYPIAVQSDRMEGECDRIYRGISKYRFSDQKGDDSPSTEEDWRLLLQVDSDEDCDFMWGDVGRLYFFVREQDAIEGNFDDVVMLTQCH